MFLLFLKVLEYLWSLNIRQGWLGKRDNLETSNENSGCPTEIPACLALEFLDYLDYLVVVVVVLMAVVGVLLVVVIVVVMVVIVVVVAKAPALGFNTQCA